MPALNRNARRLVQTPHGQLIATLTETGVTLRPFRKRKGLHISYEELAQLALDKLPHLRWPPHLKHPLERIHHLGRRQIS